MVNKIVDPEWVEPISGKFTLDRNISFLDTRGMRFIFVSSAFSNGFVVLMGVGRVVKGPTLIRRQPKRDTVTSIY